MYKKFFSYLGVLVLICFSFYYTDSAVNIIIRNDPIMKEIVSVSSNYKIEPVNAIFFDNNVVPGVNGKEVNIDESYSIMKGYGEFNSDLLVFKEVIPTISISSIFDKYISYGNRTKRAVSIIVVMNDINYLENITKVLNTKNIVATFFFKYDDLINSKDIIHYLYKNNQKIELLDYNKDNIKEINKILSNYNDKLNYCYSNNEDINTLNICKKLKLYTIIPSINTDNYLYNDVKSNLENASIIKIENNQNVLRELSTTINYIYQKGYDFLSLEDLLKE